MTWNKGDFVLTMKSDPLYDLYTYESDQVTSYAKKSERGRGLRSF